ncbi:hypothetical protein [Methylobacterium aquaticum]|uniref:hypothetical protein n=1 Tax=Methylobacterium aquaticum TaxID=270351 RepID=UPI001931C737|nr:hypothetical protein [Methylobacterium aquaticum]
MTMQSARRQTLARAGRSEPGRGEAPRLPDNSGMALGGGLILAWMDKLGLPRPA